MGYSTEIVSPAHRHCVDNRREVERSDICGCFYCQTTFAPSRIERWLNEGAGTAICPECQIDAVIGSASGYPVNDPTFLREMYEHWFE